MGVRAIRARVECDRETLLALWRTHRVFNERLPNLITKLFAMRRGEVGATSKQKELYQRVARFILARDSKDAPYLLNSVSIRGWKPATALKMKATHRDQDGVNRQEAGDTWANEAADLSRDNTLAFDKERERDGLPDSLFQPLTRDAVAYVSGHDELVRNWEREHAEWLKKKQEWKGREDHKPYLTLRPRFETFEQSVGGKAGKRRERWHLYLKWLRENPDLAGWRGGAKTVNAIDANAQARVARAKPWKQRSVEAEEFWKANPELSALDRLHGFYEREFVRRRKTKKNPDGFDHRPTFTMPDPLLHPRWVLFNAPQTSPKGYRALSLPRSHAEFGSVELCLLTGDRDGGEWRREWKSVRFRSDPRLAQFSERTETTTFGKGKKRGQAKTKQSFFYTDNQLGGISRPAQIGGAKLIFQYKNVKRLHALLRTGTLADVEEAIPHLVTPYLVFTCTIEDEALSSKAKEIQWSDAGGLTKAGKPRRKKTLPPELVSVAIDLDARGIGFLTRAISGLPESEWTHDGLKVIQSRNLVVGQLEATQDGDREWSAGPTLEHIRDHKWEIRRARRQRGKPVKAEQSHVPLQEHITNMGKDRFKKAARKIVTEAIRGANQRTGEVYRRADVLIMEDLKWFNPDATRERGINRMLSHWNRSNLMKFVEEFATDAGIRYTKYERVSAWGTSQTCSKCGAVGKRYRIELDTDTKKPVIRFAKRNEPLPLFACPNPACRGRSKKKAEPPFTCNADHNASINLHRRYVMGERATGAFAGLPKDDADRRQTLESIEAQLLPALERLHGLPSSQPETPF